MANTPQARKRVRQANKARRQNASQRSMVRTYIKRVRASVAEKDAEGAQAALKAAIPVIDKMVTKGILHANAAARQKSRLNAAVKAVAQG